MANAVELIVKLKALDKLSEPLKKLNTAVQTTNSRLQALKSRQAEIADYKKLSQTLNDTGSALSKAKENAKNLERQLISVQNPTAKMKQEYAKARQEVTKLSAQQKSQTETLNKAKTALQQAGVPVNNLSSYNAKLTQSINKANQQLDNQTAKVKKLAEQEAKIQALKEKHGKDMQHLAMVGASGYAAMNVGKRALSVGSSLIQPGIEFDKEMSNVQALARLNKDDPAMLALREQAKQLGRDTAFTSADAARGQAFLAMAGYTPEAIQNAMPALLNTALAGDLDLGRASDIVSDIAGAFSMDASQTGNIADILSLTSATSNTNLEQLAETMKYVAPVAKTAGLSLEKVSAMTGLLANVGIKGSESGTVLRAMILRLSAPTGAAGKALEQLGIQVKDANGNIKDMPELLKDLSWATKNMGSADKLAALKNIFGERPAAGIAKLLENADAKELSKYINQISTEYEGAAKRMADTKMDHLEGDLVLLDSAWQGVGQTLNDIIAPILRQLAQWLTATIVKVNELITKYPNLSKALVFVAAALAATVTAVGGLIFAFAGLAAPIKVLAFSFKMLGLASAAGLWPIILVVGAIAIAAGLLIYYWKPISGFFIELWGTIKGAFTNAFEFLANFWSDVSSDWGASLKALGALILDFSPIGLFYKAFAAVMDYFGIDLPDRFSEFGANLINGLVNGITSMIGKVKDAITGVGDSTVGWFKEKLGIHSPSRVFAELGVNTLQGYNQGLNKEQGSTIAYLSDFSKKVTATAAGITFATGVAAAPIGAGSAQAMSTPVAGDTITINIYAQQGQSAQDIAAEIERVLAQRERQKQIRAGSRLGE